MDDANVKKLAGDALAAMNTAITSARLYPPGSALISNTIQRLYLVLAAVFDQTDAIVFAEAEKNLLIQGDPLPEKEQKRPQILSFVSLMLDFGIRSLTFRKGITEKEISGFIQIMARSPEDVKAAGGLGPLMESLNPAHIKIDEQVFVKLDENHRSVAETVLTVFQDLSAEDLLKTLVKDPEKPFDDKGFTEFITHLDEEKFAALAVKIKKITEAVSEKEGYSPAQQKFVELISRLVRDEERRRSDGIEKPTPQPAPPSAAEKNKPASIPLQQTPRAQPVQLEKLKTAMHAILTGKTAAFPDIADVEGLGAFVEKMARKGKKSLVSTIIDRLGDGLKNEDPRVRAAAAEMLARIDEHFETVSDLLEERLAMSQKLCQWIRQETSISAAFENVAEQMRKLSQTLIAKGQAESAGTILEVYHQIATGNLTKEEAIQSLSVNMLQHLATKDILDLLLKESEAKGPEKKKDQIYSMILMGTTTVEMLLDRLHDSHNRSERNRIIQVITKIGKPAVSSVVERLRQDGPWFYVRNLVLLLGRIGTPEHFKILERMMVHEDFRVQREAVFALQNIGGPVEEILLRKLFAVEDETKMIVISVLGLLKYREAVPVLLDIIENRNIGATKKTKDGILIKACEALGRIKDPAAIPALKKLAASKGFLSILAQDPEVRAAAKKALAEFKEG